MNKHETFDNYTIQKAESDGYDAAIVYWSKFLLPIEDVIKKLQGKHFRKSLDIEQLLENIIP